MMTVIYQQLIALIVELIDSFHGFITLNNSAATHLYLNYFLFLSKLITLNVALV